MALGRAIIAETPVCLMDEPLSNLDAQLRAEMRREIRALQQKLGITMVYVTHDQSEAMSMADQVILMRDGRVEQAAAPDELYARPATVFAARFIGTPPMNILTLDRVPACTPRPCRRGDVLLLGIRPEDVHARRRRHAGARAERRNFSAPTRSSPALIGSQTLTARVPGKAIACRRRRDPCRLAPEHVHFFDAASGARRDDVMTARRRRQPNSFVQADLA